MCSVPRSSLLFKLGQEVSSEGEPLAAMRFSSELGSDSARRSASGTSKAELIYQNTSGSRKIPSLSYQGLSFPFVTWYTYKNSYSHNGSYGVY